MKHDPRDGAWRLGENVPPDRLDRVLKGLCPDASWRQVRDLIVRGKVTVDRRSVTDAAHVVTPGCELAIVVATHRLTEGPPPEVLPAPQIVHCDRHVVVVHKPAGQCSVAWTDAAGERDDDEAADGTPLDRQLAATLSAPVRVVHRLDRDTTGLLVFARTAEAEGRLTHQFRRHSVHRRYLALAHGACAARTFRSHLGRDRGDGLRGSVPAARGKLAVTHVEVVESLRGATLLACRLETGRTHQIRIHLAEHGHMLVGERAYVREHRGARLSAARIMLHAAELGFLHPSTDLPLQFAAPLPADMAAAIAALR